MALNLVSKNYEDDNSICRRQELGPRRTLFVTAMNIPYDYQPCIIPFLRNQPLVNRFQLYHVPKRGSHIRSK